jgi:O-antigen ligase
MIAIAVLIALLLAGVRWPGALLAGCLFTYQAGAIANISWIGIAYVAGAASIGAWHSVKGRFRLRLTSLDVALFSFLIGAAVSTAYAPLPGESASAYLRLILSVGGMYSVARLLARDPGKVTKELLVASVVSGGILSLALLLGRSDAVRYSTRLYLDANTDASAVGIAQPFPFVIFCALAVGFIAKRSIVSGLALGAGGITLIAAIISSTRSVFISLSAAAILYLILMLPHLKFGRLGRFSLFSLIALMSAPIFVPLENISASVTRLTQNFTGTGISLADASALERKNAYREAVDMFLKSPIFGQGYNSYPQITGIIYPHNIFLEVASELGLFGISLLLIWIAVFAKALLRIYKVHPVAGAALIGISFAAFVQMQLSFSLFMARPLFLLSALAAALVSQPHFARRRLPTGLQARPINRSTPQPTAKRPRD